MESIFGRFDLPGRRWAGNTLSTKTRKTPEVVQFSIVPGARLFSLGKRILTRHPCESSLVFYRRKPPKINKRVHFLTNPPKNAHPHQPHAFCVGRARAGPRPDCLLAAHPCAGARGPRPRDVTKPVSIVQCTVQTPNQPGLVISRGREPRLPRGAKFGNNLGR